MLNLCHHDYIYGNRLMSEKLSEQKRISASLLGGPSWGKHCCPLCAVRESLGTGVLLEECFATLHASQVVLVVKNPPVNTGDTRSLGWKDPLVKEMATHSCILAWEIPETWRATVRGVAKSRTQLSDRAFMNTHS